MRHLARRQFLKLSRTVAGGRAHQQVLPQILLIVTPH